MDKKLPPDYARNQRLSNLASHLIIVAMMVSFSVAVSQLLKWILHPSEGGGYPFQWGFLPILALLITLEAIFTRPVTRDMDGQEKILYHFAEWITIAVVCKLIVYLLHGFDQLPLDLPRWQANFFSFFEGEFAFTFFFVLIIWSLSRTSANNIEELNVDPTDIQWELGKLKNSRATIRASLVSRIFGVGLIMVFITSMVRINIASLVGLASIQEPVISVMLYFFLALVLFSQTQYALLHGSWFWYQTPVNKFLTRSWVRYSLVLFGLLAALAFLLPTGYSMGLLETLNFVLAVTINLFVALFQLLLIPIIWLLSLAGCTRQPQQDTTSQPPPPPIIPPQTTPTVMPWLEMLKSILFWAAFIGIIAYALVTFIRQNPQMLAILRRIHVFDWMGGFWHWLGGWLHGAGIQVGQAFQQARIRLFPKRDDSLLRRVQRWANFRQLNPRQKIIFYYLRLIERGGERGIQRRSFETPYQYASSLESNLPEVQEDISGMTETFLEARYSVHPIGGEKTSLAQRFWRNITRSLNRLRKPGEKSDV
jgi:hypothetical protein